MPSWDCTWPNSFYLLVEYFHNSGNVGDASFPEASGRFFDGEIITGNQNFLETAVGYEINIDHNLNWRH